MGGCFSKKSVCASSTPVSVPEKIKSDTQSENKKPVEEIAVKKEVFIIKHRKSHEVERARPEEEKVVRMEKAEVEVVGDAVGNGEPGIGIGPNGIIVGGGGGGTVVRTSSCTKEEVDAILIQCGRLSRSSSTGKAAGAISESGGRKYSGSKRSYDFDNESGKTVEADDDDAAAKERENRHRQRHRQSQGRRRTPSRERERDQATAAQQRSSSRERGSGGGGARRVSRSPGRRSESPIPTNSNGVSVNSNSSSKPGKMVSVPATVSSTTIDKSNNGAAGCGGGPTSTPVKRIQVKRNVGGGGGDGAVASVTRTAASPRARSPARLRAANEITGGQNQLQPMSLSRSNSRTAEHSPFRRNPLAEIDTNIITSQVQAHKIENKINNSKQDKTKEQQQTTAEENKGIASGHIALNVISSSVQENLNKPNNNGALTRSRSSRLSRDLDAINPEALSSNPTSYTALLLEDIHNFHHKNTTTPPPPAGFSLPPCVTKACSILEAVADLNSSTGANVSATFLQRNPILESEVVGKDDLMEPSFHKYVTVRRGTIGGEELEEQESSGSNSFVSSQQQWLSSSSWEPNSAESTDHWASSSSSRSACRQNEVSPMGLQRHMVSESGKVVDESGKRQTIKNQQSGIGRGRIGSRGPQAASAGST